MLLRGIFEATEVLVPTTFIILDNQLPPELSAEEQDQLMLSLKTDGSGTELAGDLKAAKEQFDKVKTWLERLQTFGKGVIEGDPNKVFGKIKKVFGDLMTKERMYLYLIDELTGLPVRGDGYPKVITTPSEIVHKLLPLMQVGLRAMSIFNGAAGIAQMVGYPVPKVPKAWAKGARESVDMLKQKSSVEGFDVVQNVVDKEGGEKKSDSVRGHSLRVFTDFMEKNDPGLKAGKSGHFAGLQRVPDPNSGTALWTTLTDPQQINEALEARTSERKEEEAKAEGRGGRRRSRTSDRKAEELDDGTKGIEGQVPGAPAGPSRKWLGAREDGLALATGKDEKAAEAEVAGKTVPQVVGSSDLQHEQITIQLSQIQDDLSQLKRDGVSCKCIIS